MTDTDSHRALLHALIDKSTERTREALATGADPNGPPRNARPLHLAALLGPPETIKLLVERGADPDAADDIGRRPLHYAALVPGRLGAENTRALVESRADVNAPDDSGCFPMDLASGMQNEDTARVLKQAKAQCREDRRHWVQSLGSSTTPGTGRTN